MATTGHVFDLSTGCVDDGPGLRTVVYLKGCRLDCPWCHNPESIPFERQISLSLERCIQCGRCQEACPRDWDFEVAGAWREGCDSNALCVAACPSGARRLVGREVEAGDLVGELLVNRDFFEGTGGGVTFSGGEPLMQADFVFACAEALRAEGVHVAVETAGYFAAKLVPALAGAVDLVLFDLKHVSASKMKEVVGKDLRPILANLETLLASDVDLELRITLIPGFNETEADLEAFASWLAQSGHRVPPITLQPFHRMATAKHSLYGTEYAYADSEAISKEALAGAVTLLSSHGLPVGPEAL